MMLPLLVTDEVRQRQDSNTEKSAPENCNFRDIDPGKEFHPGRKKNQPQEVGVPFHLLPRCENQSAAMDQIFGVGKRNVGVVIAVVVESAGVADFGQDGPQAKQAQDQQDYEGAMRILARHSVRIHDARRPLNRRNGQ